MHEEIDYSLRPNRGIVIVAMPVRLLSVLFSVLLAASGVAGVALHVCQTMGGVAVGDCDCETQAAHTGHPDHGAHAQSAPGPKLETQPCCSVELTDANSVVAINEASGLQVDDAEIAFAGLVGDSVPKSQLACVHGLLRERAPPDIHDPPIFIRNCSFLN